MEQTCSLGSEGNHTRMQVTHQYQYLTIRRKLIDDLIVIPHTGDIDMCGPKGYGFSATLVINRVWFLHSSLELGIFFLEEAGYLFIIIDKTINKNPSQCL